MIKFFTGLLFVLLLSCASGSHSIYAQKLMKSEPTIGIGLLQVSLNRDIPLYKTSKSKKAFDSLSFNVVAEGKDKGKFRMATGNNLDLKPYTFYEGDSEEEARGNINMGLVYFAPSLVFRVLERIENKKYSGYLIVLNEESLENAFVKDDEFHHLYLKGKPYWEMDHNSGENDSPWFLYETWKGYLKRLYSVIVEKDTRIYKEINGNFSILEEKKAFSIKEVKGEWAKVSQIGKDIEWDGWIKWTDGVKLLMRPVTAIYY